MSTPAQTSPDVVPAIDDDALTDFALRLVAEPSLSCQEGGVAAIVGDELRRLGFEVDVDEYGNLTGTLDFGPGPCILLDSHMDTVGVTDPTAWSRSPSGEIAEGRLYGRGAMDMKGQLAASIYGAAALRGKLAGGRVVVSASVAEELAEGPMLRPALERVQPDRVIICEATDLRLSTGQRGRAEVLVEVDGRPSHSAAPELGLNAVEVMTDIIRAIREIELPVHERMGTGILVLTDMISRPFPGLSVVPDHCAVTYDRRTLPGESDADVLGPIQAIVEEVTARWGTTGRASIAIDRYETYTGASVETPNFAPAWETASDHPVVGAARAALTDVGLDTDLSYWSFCTNGSASAGQLGIPTVGYGPGREELAHRVDEYIPLADLHSGARGYAALIEGLLNIDPEA